MVVKIDPQLYDVVNLLSGYFLLALYLNQLENGEEVPLFLATILFKKYTDR